MGNLLTTPVTDKETHTGATDDFQYGLSSMQGWRVHMEDAHIAEANLYAVVDDEVLLNKIKEKKGTIHVDSTPGQKTTISLPGHALFGVFDGHSGTFAAQYAGDNYCRVLSQQSLFAEYAIYYQEASAMDFESPEKRSQHMRQGFSLLEQALQQAFVTLDCEIAMAVRGTPHPEANTPYQLPGTKGSASAEHAAHLDQHDVANTKVGEMESSIDTAMKAAREAAAQQAKAQEDDGDSGSTACCVLVTPDWLVCANAGDSRAVFSRSSRAVPLSFDHKPDDEGEERRIRSAGGYVAGGRVEGDLAVSRGLGDFRFKHPPTVLANIDLTTQTPQRPIEHDVMLPQDQKVSPVPDVILQMRNPEQDEFIILACDGIWDVQTRQECVEEVAKIFQGGESDVGLLCEEVCVDLGLRCLAVSLFSLIVSCVPL
jgi:serine/threonine protein phosphatase PrpC